MGSGVLGAVGRAYRRSSAAVASVVLGSPPALAGVAGEGGEGEDGDLRSQRQEKRWQSFLSRRESGRYEEEGKMSDWEEREGASTTSVGREDIVDGRARRSDGRLRHGLNGDGDGDGDGGGDDPHDGRQCHAGGPLQDRSLQDTTQSRRRGADKVRKAKSRLLRPVNFILHRMKASD